MIHEKWENRSPSQSLHGRTRMIVFPARRSVGLKAATASSRAETLPMFVRSRPSRTRWTISLSWARSDTRTKSSRRWAAPRSGRRWSPAFLRLGSGLRTALLDVAADDIEQTAEAIGPG